MAKADQGNSIEGENLASAAEVAVATPGAPATGASSGMVKKRLPDAEVQSILFRERREFAPDISNMSEEEVEIINRGIEAFDILNNEFAEYQAVVRAQYEAKGYVELGDDYVEYSEEERQWLREQLADLFDDLDLSDVQEEEDDYNNKSEDEREAGISPESKLE